MAHIIEKQLDDMGIAINGNNSWDIKVHDPRFFNAILYKQSIGAGEAYMAGWWDCEKLDELFFKISRNKLDSKFASVWKNWFLDLKNVSLNQQTPIKSLDVGNTHYNLGNKLFECMLGESMAYTCAYWKDAQSLDEAQFAKYELVCQKMDLKAKDKVLELGCGWGGLAKYMAQKYDCEVVAIDITREPSRYAKTLCQDLAVTVYECDYRDVNTYNPKKTQFDKIVSVGVLEHVGYKNYSTLLQIAENFIKPDGIFLLHSIGGNVSKHFCDPWIDKYIFPHGMLPSVKQLGAVFENRFIVEDLHNFGFNYDHTLLAWHKNLNDRWPELKKNYDERFRRMMNYYLLSCAGVFRARGMQLWEFALTPQGMLNGYKNIR